MEDRPETMEIAEQRMREAGLDPLSRVSDELESIRFEASGLSDLLSGLAGARSREVVLSEGAVFALSEMADRIATRAVRAMGQAKEIAR